MKKTKKLTSKILLELERTPVIELVCEKTGISRNTLYRWMKENPAFRVQVEEALSLSVGRVNDICISNLLSGIQAKDYKYTVLWLTHRHPDFRRPYIIRTDPNDTLQYHRMLNEKEQLIRVETEAKDLAERQSKEKIDIAMKEVEEWQAMWIKDIPITKEDRELFEQWKKEKKQKE